MFWITSLFVAALLVSLCFFEDQRLNQECAYWKEHSQPMREIVH